MRPEWGPMHGPEAVSEQRLLETAIGRLPAAAAVIGDSNFGVFSVVWSALQTNHPVLLRLSSPRARRLLGGRTLNDGIDREVVWRCSRDDRKKHPDLPEDACVRGRVLVMRVQPDNGAAAFLLMLFTTLPVSRQPLLKLYGQRWNIETDLRTLKTQLRMDQLSCATPDMVAREIEMSIAAYNLVRAMIYLASEQSGFPPRQYGFTRASRVVLSFAPRIAMALNDQDAKRLFDQMMHYLQQARRPPRRRLPSPRHVWGKGAKFPNRKC